MNGNIRLLTLMATVMLFAGCGNSQHDALQKASTTTSANTSETETTSECPDFSGTYKVEGGKSRFYVEKTTSSTYLFTIETPYDPPITQSASVKRSNKEQSTFCTLDIDGFGTISPWEKGSIYHITFDSRDFEKVINTDYILKLKNLRPVQYGVDFGVYGLTKK
ncbi:hypothetical protein [Hafnia alvei]|uniref:hypothetical protein n=1 Tax=Hafnia alvei TaxID=569 RepID=UPI00345CBAE1